MGVELAQLDAGQGLFKTRGDQLAVPGVWIDACPHRSMLLALVISAANGEPRGDSDTLVLFERRIGALHGECLSK